MTTEHSPSAAGFSGRAPLRCVALNAKRPLAPTKSKRKGTRAKAAAMMTLQEEEEEEEEEEVEAKLAPGRREVAVAIPYRVRASMSPFPLTL